MTDASEVWRFDSEGVHLCHACWLDDADAQDWPIRIMYREDYEDNRVVCEGCGYYLAESRAHAVYRWAYNRWAYNHIFRVRMWGMCLIRRLRP